MSFHVGISTNPKSFPLLGAALAIVFWVVDAAIDAHFFQAEDTFVESLFRPEPIELWMRSLVVVILILFGYYAKANLISQQKNSAELRRYKDHLEQLVDHRTRKLHEANSKLIDEISERKTVEAELERLATTDPLTSLFNRRKFEALLDYEIEKDRRYPNGLSLIFCDIDRFKRINDEHGHDVGDEVLKTFSIKMKNSIRSTDFIARWGGEEFVLIIAHTTPELTASMAEKLRETIASHDFPEAIRVTASFGVSHLNSDDTRSTLISRADEALYLAKENGRNRVEVLLV